MDKETYEVVFSGSNPKKTNTEVGIEEFMQRIKQIGFKPIGCVNTEEVQPDGKIKYTHRALFDMKGAAFDPYPYYNGFLGLLFRQKQFDSFFVAVGDRFEIEGKYENQSADISLKGV